MRSIVPTLAFAMPLNTATVGTLFRTELRVLLRDRRTLLTSILLPLLITPIMLLASSWTQRAREKKLDETVYNFAVTGAHAGAVRSFVAAISARQSAADPQPEDAFKFEEIPTTSAAESLANRDIHFYLEGLTADEARAAREAARAARRPSAGASGPAPPGPPPKADADTHQDWREPFVDGAPVVQIVFRADRDDSQSGAWRMRGALHEARREQRASRIEARGFPIALKDVAAITEANLATEGQVAGLALGRAITMFVLLLIMSGCAVVATDSLAGEKERGTLETLLTTGATRLEIIVAKHLTILVVAVTIALIQATNLVVYIGFKLIPVSANLAAALPPGVALLLLLLFLPLTALAASVMLLTSGYAKSYKEAQLYFTPVFILGIMLALASFLPDLPLRSAIVALPVANIAVAARDVLVGSFDWPMLAVAWLVTAAAAAGTTQLSVRFLSAEKLITATDSDAVDFAGGPAVFGRHVLRWFAVMWALLLIISNYTGTADLRWQVTINLVGLFFGGSLLMLRRYRLDVRSTLALRRPRPLVWFAVLGAVPSGILAGIGVMHFSNLLFPVSPEFMRDMAEAFKFDGMPTWQLVLFIGLFPGFFEEIAFRGVLLHGLHRRLHPGLLIVVVGVIFGIFHVTLPRIIPTAYIGLLLTATVLLTGSIYPAMLWHALNNTLMVLVGEEALEVFTARPVYALAGAVVLALCFALLWWNRTPYPGLRPWRRATRETASLRL